MAKKDKPKFYCESSCLTAWHKLDNGASGCEVNFDKGLRGSARLTPQILRPSVISICNQKAYDERPENLIRKMLGAQPQFVSAVKCLPFEDETQATKCRSPNVPPKLLGYFSRAQPPPNRHRSSVLFGRGLIDFRGFKAHHCQVVGRVKLPPCQATSEFRGWSIVISSSFGPCCSFPPKIVRGELPLRRERLLAGLCRLLAAH